MSNEKETRKQALEQGKQRDVSDVARESGLLVPAFITSTVWETWVTPDDEGIKQGENEKTRLRRIIDNLIYYIRVHRQTNKSNLVYFPVPLTRGGKAEDVQLLSHLGPIEQTDNRPCITIMTPEEYDLKTAS